MYKKRAKLVGAIPRFWGTVLEAEPELQRYLGANELALINSLVDLRVEKKFQDPRNFTIAFTFAENHYLEAQSLVLSKDFKFVKGRLVSVAVPIQWKVGKEPTCRSKSTGAPNFFSFFSWEGKDGANGVHDVFDGGEDVALLICDEIYPHALGYYADAITDHGSLPDSIEESPVDTPPETLLETMSSSFLDEHFKDEAGSKSLEQEALALDGPGAPQTSSISDFTTKMTNYCLKHTTILPDYLSEHRHETAQEFGSLDMISELQGRLFTFVTNVLAAKKVLELGTFTGYSAMCFAEGGATVTSVEISEELSTFAKLSIHKYGKAQQITVVHSDASLYLGKITGKYDIIFLDADIASNHIYVEKVFSRNLLSPNGIIIANRTISRNTVMSCQVEDTSATSRSNAYHESDTFVGPDSRLQQACLPMFDGLTILRRRAY